MTAAIPPLKAGDLLMIVSPAKAIEPVLVMEAKDFWEAKGFTVEVGEYSMGRHHYFSGTDDERLADFQEALDNPEVKAIICSRGGYGCIRIVDRLNWAGFLRQPKWIIGFSDVTVLHQRIQKFALPSVHATMPLNYSENSPEALQTLVDSVTGKLQQIEVEGVRGIKTGSAKGKLMGGNLSILYSLLGTDDQPDYSGSILYIEDLAEQLYHIDRMLYAFAKAGIFQRIKALVVGSFTDLKNTEPPFGMSFEELLMSHFSYRNIPIVFEYPAGHIPDNRALILGTEVELHVEAQSCVLQFLNN